MMTLTKYGIREWGVGLVAAVVLLAGCCWLGAAGHPGWGAGVGVVVVGPLSGGSPPSSAIRPRRLPEDPRQLASPADGVVRDIGEVEDFNFPPFNGRAVRIGIFLSVLNVHVNRTPAELEVESKYYREGEFLDARHPECAVRNEAMTIAGTAKAGDVRFPLAIRQISGKIARKIVCPVDPGRTLRRGEVYGMIKFGSRTELYLPVDPVRYQGRHRRQGPRRRNGRRRNPAGECEMKRRFRDMLQANKWLKYVPNSLTLCNSLCGFLAILITLRAYEARTVEDSLTVFFSCAVIICCAMIFDSLDGLAARIFNAASMHGVQMDSLADMVTFALLRRRSSRS